MAWKPDYVTGAEVLAALGSGETFAGSPNEATISRAITAASRSVDARCSRQFGSSSADTDRTYPGAAARLRDGIWSVLEIEDLQSATGLTVTEQDEDGNETAVTDYELRPLNAAADGRPFTQIAVRTVSPAYRYKLTSDIWGWAAVPEAVKQATIMQTLRYFKRKDAPFGVAGSPEFGSETRLLAAVDPDVRVVLRPYRRWRTAAG